MVLGRFFPDIWAVCPQYPTSGQYLSCGTVTFFPHAGRCLCHFPLSGVTLDVVSVWRNHGLREFTAGRDGRFPFPTFQVCWPHHWSLVPGRSHDKTRKGYVLGVFAPLRACAYPETQVFRHHPNKSLGLYLQGELTPHLPTHRRSIEKIEIKREERKDRK